MDEQKQPEVDLTVLPDGHELEGNDGKERIVHDLDEDGNVIGWHKEQVGK